MRFRMSWGLSRLAGSQMRIDRLAGNTRTAGRVYSLPAGWQGPFFIGTVAAAVSSLAAIWALLGYVRRHDYTIFVVYRLIVAAIVLLLIASGAREAGF